MPENLGQKGLTKVVKICVKIMPELLSKGVNWLKRVKSMLGGSIYAGFSQYGGWLFQVLSLRGDGGAARLEQGRLVCEANLQVEGGTRRGGG
jgi:hypothetical protein